MTTKTTMTTKINLSNLTNSDYKALLENNKVLDKLISFTTEPDTLFANEQLYLLEGVREYSLGSSCDYNYLTVNNSYQFLNSVLIAQKDYNLLTDTLIEKIEQVLSYYKESEPSAQIIDWDKLEDKLDNVSDEVSDRLVDNAKSEIDYLMSEPYLLEAMKEDDALISIYGEDAYYNRDNNKIYYICADQQLTRYSVSCILRIIKRKGSNYYDKYNKDNN